MQFDGCGFGAGCGLGVISYVWAWLVGVASVLELVFKKLEPMCIVVEMFGWMNFLIKEPSSKM